MKNPEKLFFPVAIGAAVIGIWVALRKGSTAVQAAGPGLNIPGLPPLQTTEYGPPPPINQNVPATGTNPDYNGAAVVNPMALNLTDPAATLAPYSYLNYNVPPWTDLSKLLGTMDQRQALNRIMQTVPPGETFSQCGEGCGCSGPGGSSGASECNQTVNPIQPDGHGSCLTATPKVPALQFSEQHDALRYMANVPYDCARSGSEFDLNCLSLFMTQAPYAHGLVSNYS